MSTLLVAAAADPNPPCWARSATGVVLAAVLWLGFLGVRATVRRYRDGQLVAARVTGAGVAVGVLAGFAMVWFAFSLSF